MADVKTNLRELSVGFYFYRGQVSVPITPNYFLDICVNNITNCWGLDVRSIASNATNFTPEEIQIINNGSKLGKAIQDVFKIGAKPRIWWEGFKTQSGEAVDLIIDNFRFSLKEESFILENMGLYKIMNLIMDKEKYRRGLHVFEEFAPDYLYQWFDTTRQLLLRISPIPWMMRGRNYQSIVSLDKDNTLILTFKGRDEEITSKIVDFPLCDYHRFEQSTTSITREKVFSKWLKEMVESESEYIASKRSCALAAGKRIESLLQPYIGTSPTSLLRLFRTEEYYYAKTTAYNLEIYQIPSKDRCVIPFVIKDIQAKVPQHQLNIHTTIENQEAHKIIEFRNELRYSHGQFNGTPEAKFYIASGDMTALYKKLYPIEDKSLLHV